MQLSQTLLSLSILFFAGAFVCHLLAFTGVREGTDRLALALMRAGFLISTLYFLEEAVEHKNFLPVYTVSQAMAFFSWALAFVYLVLFVRIQSESFGLILTPILLFFMVLASLTTGIPAKPLDVPVDAHFTVHIISAFFAYACLTISFAAGVLYLIRQHELKSRHPGPFYHKLPALEALEKLIFQPMIWGAFLLAEAIAVGIVWSKSAYGKYWLFDPKTIIATVTMLFYFLILYLHYVSSIRGKRVVVFSLVAFSIVIISFIGMRFVAGSHNFMQPV